ncbi:PSD1 and planctomycete cytochrome C domain-containing protein [Urbifossiella limnaea]|uniref:Planctomycete cytochrome C n=1 Tax=Urbifossiella limnaea TaxID=2528023 RepID=A0A517Y2K8_9BACT|nr:PSD1 and planctomycete cytochrome C domain-containing protein [Urbifossiella limnaea]QDU23985.1 Planctomycete cytochrome C [Urbifossiella limnaea]
MLGLSPRLLPLAALVALAVTATAQPPDHAAKMAKGTELFKSAVRDVLAKKCQSCHSGTRVEGEFDLGTREALLKGGAGGPAVVPGDHKKSLLYQLVAHQREPHMPHERAKLPAADIARIAEWIDLGAPYDRPLLGQDAASAWTRKVVAPEARQHWAFQPLKRPAAPAAIDAFVQAKLKEKGLDLGAPAEPRVLLRRVYLDLIGLPPTPEQIDAFEKDHSPAAFEKVVDELLASPAYGERWARHWLDLVRFAESHGFEHDYDRPTAYHYRDFVIKALNADLPFDTFTRWQLAGDELAPTDPLAVMATGYLAAGVHSTQITQNEVAKHRYDELDDIVANVGTTFLGLTVGCARCHDHKYDPVPARDYYRMVSAFTTAVRTEMEFDLEPEKYRRDKAAFDAAHAPLAAAVTKYEAEELPAKLAAWETARGDTPLSFPWVLPEITGLTSAGGATTTKQGDGSVLVTGKNPTTENLKFTLVTTETGVKALRVEALTHPSLVRGGPGRATNGNFALSNVQVQAAPKDKPAEAKRVKLTAARATFEQKGLGVADAIDGNVNSAWAIDPQFGKDHAAAFAFEQPVGFPGGTVFTVTLAFNNNTGHGMGRPRLAVSTDAGANLTAPAATEAVRAAFAAKERTPAQTAALLAWFAPQDAGWRERNKAAADHLAKAPKPNLTKALVTSEGLPPIRLHSQGDDFLKETHYLRRGDAAQKDGVADVSFLQVLMPAADAQAKWLTPPPAGSRTRHTRAAFARWLTDADGGAGNLVARVIVNRLWQRHLGRGIVPTVSDFGVRGEPPSHPELLDFLASELVRGGWKLKPIHRQIVLSRTYQQGSGRDAAKEKADPDGRLFGRFPVRRLEAEVIRDSILSVGGILDSTPFGPGSLNDGMTRRSVYFTMKRSRLIPALTVFDAPDGTAGVGERPSTTVAPQALHLMNNPQVRAAAKGLARRALAAGDDAAVATRAYRLALGRAPSAGELADATAFLRGTTGPSREAAAADFCQVLFCLNEFLYVE